QATHAFGCIQGAEAQFTSMTKCLTRKDFLCIPFGRMRCQFAVGKLPCSFDKGPLLVVEIQIHACLQKGWFMAPCCAWPGVCFPCVVPGVGGSPWGQTPADGIFPRDPAVAARYWGCVDGHGCLP